jgi:ABC-2 type transport system permease protein
MLLGKLFSRSLVGLAQLTILFAIGWWLFGISLGRNPLALFLPAIAISFAAAAFGLIIACLARTHDSVMPIGGVFAMAMSAIRRMLVAVELRTILDAGARTLDADDMDDASIQRSDDS